MTARSRILALSAALIASACGEEPEPPPPSPAAPATDAPEVKEVARIIDGDAPTAPSVYGELEIGMNGEQAKRHFPQMPENDTLKSAEFPGTTFYVDFDGETHTIRRFFFAIPGEHVREKIEKSWGPAVEVTRRGRAQFVWFNPSNGLRGTLAPGFDSMELELTGYTPYAELLGAEGPQFAFTRDRPVLGATVAELRKGYGDMLIEQSAAEVAEGRKPLEALVDGASADAPPPAASVYIDLPPTEWEDYWTRLDLMFDDDGRVSRYWLSLGFGVHPEAKTEIFEFIVAKLGKPAETEDALGDESFVFDGAARIEVKEDTLGKAWTIEVGPGSDHDQPGAAD